MMYHIIRGQAIIKLYIFFNMLEVHFNALIVSILTLVYIDFEQDIPYFPAYQLHWSISPTRLKIRLKP